MKKIYVGCSLTHAPQEFKNSIELFKTNLRKKYEVLEFLGLVKGTDREVFLWDTKCVKDSDLFIADCTYPSLGLGYEIGVALENKKPTIAIAHKDTKISRLILGVTNPNYLFQRYDNILEILEIAHKKLHDL